MIQGRPSDALDISPGNSGEILLILEGSRGRSVARKEPSMGLPLHYQADRRNVLVPVSVGIACQTK